MVSTFVRVPVVCASFLALRFLIFAPGKNISLHPNVIRRDTLADTNHSNNAASDVVPAQRVPVHFGSPRSLRVALSGRQAPGFTSAIYDKALANGQGYYCLFSQTAEQADASIKQTIFLDPTKLGEWGWQTTDPSFFEQVPTFDGLDEPKISWAKNDWTVNMVKHVSDWDVDGKKGLKSFGQYQTFYNHDASAITMISKYMFSPQGKSPNLATYPDLGRFSDVVFLNYYQVIASRNPYGTNGVSPTGGSKIPCPKWWIANGIVDNSKTWTISIIKELLKRHNVQIDKWPGAKFELEGNEEAKVLLGTGHGRAISFFLIQHKSAFGLMGVKSVRVWADRYGVNLSFEMGPA